MKIATEPVDPQLSGLRRADWSERKPGSTGPWRHFRRHVWLTSAFAFCILFGLATIANVQLAGDGDWFWYAKLLRGGTRLYATLDLSLQPLFVLETAWFQDVFGEGWLASKIAPGLHLFALVGGMSILALRSTWSDRQQAVVLLSSFFVGIRLEAYRFDDYHVLADVFIIFSAILVLRLERLKTMRTQSLGTIALGVLAGLAITTRPNDGAVLSCFSALSVVCCCRRKLASLAVFIVTVALSVAIVVRLTGDSLVAWGVSSLLHVGALKGGSAQFATDPVRVLQTAAVYLWSAEAFAIVGILAVAFSWTFLIASFRREQRRRSLAKAAAGALIAVLGLLMLRTEISSGGVIYAALAVWTYIAYLLAFYVVLKAFFSVTTAWRWARPETRDLLLLLPFVLVVSTSLSSAGNFYDLYMPAAILILVLPLVEPFPLSRPWAKRTLIAIAAILAVSGIFYKANDPASWISYRTDPLFANRTLVRHPAYGPMVIDKTLLRFIGQLCTLIDDGDHRTELLSIPFPYANYYCVVPPWHDYVQTWFDSANKAVIDQLIGELEVAPPKWILYQRQLGTLAYHEAIFNNGQVLPQRTLDDYIMSKISDGEWKVVQREYYGQDSDWLLARTQTLLTKGRNLLPEPGATAGLAGWKTEQSSPVWFVDSRFGGRYAVRNDGFSPTESVLSREIAFAKSGPVTVDVRIEATGFYPNPQNRGYTVDVYDATTGNVVGSLGYSNANDATHDYSFTANVDASHENQLQLRFGADVGTVYFSRLAVADASSAHSSAVSAPTSLAGWSASMPSPRWSYDKEARRFTGTVRSAGVIETTLYRPIRFEHDGPVAVQVTVGADSLDTSGGYGYVVDLYDATKNAISGSLGVPAMVSAPRHYSFTAAVTPKDRYRLRLRLQTSNGSVTFSGLKVEYGSVPTP